MPELSKGDAAPALGLPDQNGNAVNLSDFQDRMLLVYFYPKADTPGCTIQSCSVRDSLSDLLSSGIGVVGISPDVPVDQLKFDEKYSLGFPLLADPDHRVAEAYDVWRERNLYGKKKMGILRSSFLVGKDGKIIEAWYKVKPEDTVPKALEAAGIR